ncbi:PD40 domain-containing protein [Curvibacter sp. CHRR-16]|uniref:oligogalacturonate lyase family protein n=1 Tax=Curvibacter sp. CHRR-16 TaxID=2835872 RepID=UPI001BD9A268|nr:oligogalacturonate lyase family protein [Curvibacter sp. CHRR-16]MBT0570179.1 PD40 domain-containing protein [Curvibacter sp. CHRR-16]
MTTGTSKGTVRQFQFVSTADPDTGARVTRLTPLDVACHRNYFYQKCFTQDGSKVIFGAHFGTDWNYHLLDLASQQATQLTDQEGENTFGGFLSPDDQYLYFVRAERTLVRLELATLHEEVLYTTPDEWVAYGTWVANSACTKIVGIEIWGQDWFPLTSWEKFAEMFHAKPRCRLFSVDLATGQRHVIREEKLWLGHPQYRPFDDNTVAFCHEGSHNLIDARMWFVDQDGSNLRCGKVHEPGESCTHEFWVPNGSAMVYVSFFAGKTERAIWSLDPVTLQSTKLTNMPPCSHLMSNYDGSLIVGDGSGQDPYLHLFDLTAGTTRRIARHDTSWDVYLGNRQVTHPHPSFTPDQRQVLFTTDAQGMPALYLADL